MSKKQEEFNMTEKVYLDENVWYIDNFLTEYEIEQLLIEGNDPEGWTIRMSSPYANIGNKWVGGGGMPDNPTYPSKSKDILEESIYAKISNLFDTNNSKFRKAPSLQNFIPVEDAEGYAMKYHYEHTEDNNMTDGLVIYLNDNFEGGELIFENKSFSVKPKRGRLIRIPVTKEYSHGVNKVSGGTRITFYGHCFKDIDNVIINEVC